MDLVGIEPTTSSMPWKRAPKLRHRPIQRGLLPLILTHVLWLVKPSKSSDTQTLDDPQIEPCPLELEASCETCENEYAESEETKYELSILPCYFVFADVRRRVRGAGPGPSCVLLIDF